MPKNVTDLVMTFVDDEISKINEKKMKELASNAKKHKTPAPTAKKDTGKVTSRPLPPIVSINSIIAEVFETSFPLLTDASKGLTELYPKAVPVQKILDSVLNQFKETTIQGGKEWTENLAKAVSLTLLNELREIHNLGLIGLDLEDDDSYSTFITPKGIIYCNMVNYLANPDPLQHYAIYNQVANS